MATRAPRPDAQRAALLDVNVLIALLDAGHLHHRLAIQWLAEHAGAGWASCPLTQNGCVRVLSLAADPNAQPAPAVAQRPPLATTDRHPTILADTGRVFGGRGGRRRRFRAGSTVQRYSQLLPMLRIEGNGNVRFFFPEVFVQGGLFILTHSAAVSVSCF